MRERISLKIAIIPARGGSKRVPLKNIKTFNNKIDELQREFQNITFTPVDTSIVDYEQVLLMSLCQHNIIANSSFSWWGAYFNQNMSKIVTYPSKWFGPAQGNKKMDDMYPIGWEKINI